MNTPSQKDTLTRRKEFLKEVPLFAALREDDLETLVNDLRLKKYAKGEMIFQQGDASRELYIIMSGKVRVFRISPSGNETSITIFSDYDVIGEFAALDKQPRSASAKAIEPCSTLEMVGSQLIRRMRDMPELALNMTQLLAGKLRWTAAYAEAVAQYDAAGRLLHILLAFNERFGIEVEEGKRYEIDLALNQTDLASLIGARREWINRVLKSWRIRELIEYKSGKIIILDLAAVKKERDSRIEALGDTEDW